MDLADRAVKSADFMSHLKDLFFIIIITFNYIAIYSCIQITICSEALSLIKIFIIKFINH